ncbi:NmrA family transcriptional regulator [Aliikangiella marina]|uniref:NmrA family transcriptional regulator n=1 Tax=Aliikangiella marina TaxID=1712262 RepID=A0A545T6R0_9GAMM|nr:NmrA family NAD(P)-binding protein [Aliikangiella marina]TQV72911.1 NmrA family transcriptional regulator [Aliikangiella marina]
MNLDQNNSDLIVVTAPNSKTGKRVIKRLKRANLNYRGASRTTAIPFDWNKSDTWMDTLDSATIIYIVLPPELAFTDLPKLLQKFLAYCNAAQIRKIVLLSGRGEEQALACEKVALSSGIPTTVVRASWFSQNFSEGMYLSAIRDGEIILPTTHVKEPFIDVEDIADVVFQSFFDQKSQNKVIEVTGPELLSFDDVARQFTLQLGKPVKTTFLPINEYLATLRQAGVSEQEIELIAFLYTDLLDGRNANITHDVKRTLGREARTFSEYIQATQISGIWQ